MNAISEKQPASRPDGAVSVLLGRPLLAGNSGAGIPQKLLRAFETADLTAAEFVRLPAPRSRCRLTGLSRTTLNELIERAVVQAITVRQPGATRGIKLINKASLLSYLHQLEAEQNALAEPSPVATEQSQTGEGGTSHV